MRDVNYGWLIRYLHANTASFFFIFVYLHIGRGLYYGSYKSPRTLPWTIGTIILIMIIAIAFLGYSYSPKWNWDFIFNNDVSYNDNIVLKSSIFGFVKKPSDRLIKILKIYNLKGIYYLESNGDKKHIKIILNREASVYLCINLCNGELYVGSASKGYVYSRYRAHLFLGEHDKKRK